MKILIVGGGGREHALAWRLAQSPSVSAVLASPGNPGIARVATCYPAAESIQGYADLAERMNAELTVVGPEAPLVGGIVDLFRSRDLRIVGPTRAAARLEGSKIFAKQFLERAGIPTARSVQCTTLEEASRALREFALPVVIKADGLAAGKGVIIACSEGEAQQAVKKLGPAVVVEEFLEGEEVSFIGLSTDKGLLRFAPTQDHKRALDRDAGPNTGGMGAYLDGKILTPEQSQQVMEQIMLPAVDQMRRDATPFTGFLYAGLMMTPDGPKVLEFNVRMGDPETQALLYNFKGDLAQFLLGDPSAAGAPNPNSSVCVVMSAAGYPNTPQLGARITGIEEAEQSGAVVFQAGTKQSGEDIVVSGGRVLGVTAEAETLPLAIESAYRAVSKIHFAGMHYRTDIGHKGLRRW